MNQQQDLVEIGRGNCGSVWAKRLSEVDDDDNNDKTVIKREDCNRNRSITKEHDIHKHILARLAAATMASKPDSNLITGYRVNIPTAIDFIASTSLEWASLLPRLPKDCEPCKALKNERIPPMRQHVRQLLAQRYCGTGGRGGPQGEKLAAELLDAEMNEQNCLVRPFLGRRRLPREEGRRKVFDGFSFRNFPFHLDQIEELGLPKEQYAMAMADTLAFLHWEAEVDARDVEFVLARPRAQARAASSEAASSEPSPSPPSIGSKAFSAEGVFGPHAMWLLDFDCCNKMVMPTMHDDEEAEVALLETAAKGFWGNDPWYPRPPPDINGNGNGNYGADLESEQYLADRQLWEKFKRRYLETSRQILEGKGKERMARELPRKVMGIIPRTRWRNGKLIYLDYEGR